MKKTILVLFIVWSVVALICFTSIKDKKIKTVSIAGHEVVLPKIELISRIEEKANGKHTFTIYFSGRSMDIENADLGGLEKMRSDVVDYLYNYYHD